MSLPSKNPPWGGSSPRRMNPLGILIVRDLRVRIVVLVALLLLVAGGMISLNRWASAPASTEAPAFAPTVAVQRAADTGVPPLDMSIAEQLADYGPDARRRWPGEAMHYLLLETANTPAVLAYSMNLLPLEPASAAEIDKDSRPWRFKYVRFRGELEYIREEDYEAVYGPPAPPRGLVSRGRVRVSDGDPSLRVVFLTTLAPEWADPNQPGPLETKMIEDGWVRGRGILVQNCIDSSGGDDVPALLVVATRIERDFAPVKVESLEDVPFGIIEDDPSKAVEEGGPAILAREYPQPLYRLVKYAEAMSGGEGGAQRAAKGLKPEALSTRKAWEELVGQPKKFRGRYFGGLGAMADAPLRYEPETITPNDAGVDQCLNGWLVTDQQKLMQFIAPATLDHDWRVRTRVRWEGFFYKAKLYPARDGTQRLAPVFVLTVLEEVKPPAPNHVVHIVLAAGFVLGIVLLAFIVLREDRTKQSYRRRRQRGVAAGRPTG